MRHDDDADLSPTFCLIVERPDDFARLLGKIDKGYAKRSSHFAGSFLGEVLVVFCGNSAVAMPKSSGRTFQQWAISFGVGSAGGRREVRNLCDKPRSRYQCFDALARDVAGGPATCSVARHSHVACAGGRTHALTAVAETDLSCLAVE